MVFVGDPKHARFDRAVLNACRRSSATRATVGRDCKYSWPLLAGRLAVANRHWPMLVYDVIHALGIPPSVSKAAGQTKKPAD
jgi:hypothetical protein